MKSLSEKLKEATAESHRNIEEVAAFQTLMSADLEKEEYAGVLLCWREFLAFPEHHLAAHTLLQVALPDFPARLKTPLLDHDLGTLRLGPGKSSGTPLIQLDSMAKIWGYLYVIEGSSLGSQLIVKQLKKHSFLSDDALTFYAGYGGKTGSMWKEFKARLNDWGENNPEQLEQVLANAVGTFDELAAFMRERYQPYQLQN